MTRVFYWCSMPKLVPIEMAERERERERERDFFHIKHVTPDGNTKTQIDYILISQKWRSSLQDVRNNRGANLASDHHLLIAMIELRLVSTKPAEKTSIGGPEA